MICEKKEIFKMLSAALKVNKQLHHNITRATLSENLSSGICGQRRPRSACANAQSDQGLRRLLTESLDTIEYMNGEQMHG